MPSTTSLRLLKGSWIHKRTLQHRRCDDILPPMGSRTSSQTREVSSNFPKRQHFVPKMLLKRFCDDDGWLWTGGKNLDDVYRARPRNVFVQNHLYTKHAYDDTPPSAEYEQVFGRMETTTDPVIDRIVNCARLPQCPVLSPEEQATLLGFVIALARRTPESRQRASHGISDDELHNIVQEIMEKGGYEGWPDKDEFLGNSEIREPIELVMHNSDAKFAAGVDPRMGEKEREFIAGIGVRFAVIRRPDKSFVIGSHGITICDPSVSRDLAGTVLPLAHDVLVHLTPWPGETGLLVLGGNRESSDLIDAINQATASLSNTITGRSQALIRSLLA